MSMTVAPTALIGRESDLQALRRLLSNHRLVSIVGAGGVGKTALAQTLFHALTEDFADGVCSVDLAPLTDAQQVLPTLVTALKLGVGSVAALDAVTKKLAGCQLLLVLDNCEHLLRPVAELIMTLLNAAPQLRVLSTSQEALNLHDEQVYRLGTLTIPEDRLPLQVARRIGALALFEDRACAADQHFVIDASNVVAVCDICRQLDGIPLAIELAAARVRLLGVEGLRSRLHERLRLFTGGAGDQPPRHRTLRAALEWSHGLLTAEQQVVFRRLGVMSGSFDMGTAQQICAEPDAGVWEVLDTLAALVDKSLVVTDSHPGAEPRFRLLETMRHFAQDRLAAAAEEAPLRERHLAHFLKLTESASEGLDGPQQGEWLKRLDLERDNLFAAHRACDSAPEGAARGLRLVNALMRYWFNRGALLQGARVLREATTRQGAKAQGTLYAIGLMNTARLHAFRGLHAEAITAYRQSIDAGRSCAAPHVVAESLARMGYALLELGDRVASRAALEEARALAETTGEGARARSVAISNLAELERLEGRFDAAAPLYEQTLATYRASGDRQGTMIALNNLSMTALGLGDMARVRTLALESLAICDELDSRRGRLVVMEVCAGLAADLGQWHRTTRFDAATRFHTMEMGRHRDAADEAFLASRIELARISLGELGHATATAEGRALSYGAAIDEIRSWLTQIGPITSREAVARRVAESAQNVRVGVDAVALTPREREILSLVARGFNNGDIAGLLGISVLTVRTHRQHLMEKLELRNAAEITAYAVKLGLYNPN